jgi:fatty acid desaturase
LLPTRPSHLLPKRVVAIQEGARIEKINTSKMRKEMLDLTRQDRDGEVSVKDAVAPPTARAMRVGEDELG